MQKFKIFFLLSTLAINTKTHAQLSKEDSLFVEQLKHLFVFCSRDNGHLYPGFTYMSPDRGLLSSKGLKGRVVFINFWFASCAPCIAEMDALNNLYEKFYSFKNFSFLSFTYENDSIIAATQKKYNLAFPIYQISHDSCKLLTFGNGYPSNIILNKQFKIEQFNCGGYTDPELVKKEFRLVLEAKLNELLNQ